MEDTDKVQDCVNKNSKISYVGLAEGSIRHL